MSQLITSPHLTVRAPVAKAALPAKAASLPIPLNQANSNGKSVQVLVSSTATTLAAASVAQPVSAADAISAYTNASVAGRKSLAAFVISDASSAITSSLDALEVLAKAGKIASITYTDLSANSPSTPSVTLSASKLTADKDIIAKLGSVSETVSFSGNYGTYKVVAGSSGGVTVTGGTEKSVKLATANFLSFQDKTVIASSGDKNVDALLNIGTPMWWSGPASASPSTASLHTGLYALNTDSSRHTLNYSFMSSTDISGLSGTNATGATVVTDPEKTAITSALNYLSSMLNVTFTDVTGTTTAADISFGQNTQNASAGYANPPHGNGSNATSYLFLAKNASSNPQDSTTTAFNPGTYGWETIIHEIGHTLGLKHPGNYNAGGGGASGPFLPTATDNRRYSIMSYHDPADAGIVTQTGNYLQASVLNPTSYMTYDIEALQFLYGVNSNPTGDAATALTTAQTTTFTNSFKGFETLWTPTGATLDASAVNNKSIIDLRSGAYSSINEQAKPAKSAGAYTVKYQTYDGVNNVGLTYGSTITTAKGGGGDDVIYASTYSATIDGGAGQNTLYLAGKASDWTISADKTTATLKTNTNVVETMSNISKIAYYDPTKTALTHSA